MKPNPLRLLLLPLTLLACYGATNALNTNEEANTVRSSLYPTSWIPPSATSHDFTEHAFLQDFSYAGYHAGNLEVPHKEAAEFNVTLDHRNDPVNPLQANGTDTVDDTLAIREAIKACAKAGGGIVKFPAGTYYVSLQPDGKILRISSDNIILRGEGPSTTQIINTSTNMRGKSVIMFLEPGSTKEKFDGMPVAINKDINGPGDRLFVDDPAHFSKGDEVVVTWKFTQDWIDEHGQSAFWGKGSDHKTFKVPNPVRYQREITEVDVAEGWIEVNVPIRYALKTRDNPNVQKIKERIRECGVEHLGIGNVEIVTTSTDQWGESDYNKKDKLAYNAHLARLIAFNYARNCWIKNVHSVKAAQNTTTETHMLSNGILMNKSFNMSIIDCAMQNPQYGGGGGNGYMIHLSYSNDCLIRSSATKNSRHGFTLTGAGTSGNVLHDCADWNTARATGGGSAYNGEGRNFYETGGEGSDTHNHFTHSNLWDMCKAYNSRFEAFHRKKWGGQPYPGLTSAHGVFWNTYGEGEVIKNGKSQTKIIISDQARYGYIIGTSGSMDQVSTGVNLETNTAPHDITQFIGKGESLRPQSLWLSQKSKRLNN